jgi:hypothetical protein
MTSSTTITSIGSSDNLVFLGRLAFRLGDRVRPSAVQGSHDADAGEHRGRPPLSATSISASIAACHSGASCSRFGSFVMKVAGSRKAISSRPFARNPSKHESNSLTALCTNARLLICVVGAIQASSPRRSYWMRE